MPVLLAVVATATAWLRLPAAARDVIWAEDGRNFLQDALTDGPIPALAIPYSGYLHTVPRIIAGLIVTFVPVPLYAESETLGACLAAGIAAAIVFVCTVDVVPWLPGRLAIGMLTVCAPLEPREVLGNTANLHTLMLWMLFWILLYRPRDRIGAVLLAVAAFLGAVTEIQAVFLLPLIALRWRVREARLIRISLLVGIGLQLLATLLDPRGHGSVPATSLPSVAYGYLINSVVPIWTQQKAIGPLVAAGGFGLCVLLFVPFIAVLGLILWRGTRLQRMAAISAVALSIVVYAVSVWTTPAARYEYFSLTATQLAQLSTLRYGVLPSILILSLVPLAATVVLRRRAVTRRVRPFARFALVAVLQSALVISVVVHFAPQYTLRTDGPQWMPEATAVESYCARAPDSSTVPLAETLHWSVSVQCWRLEPAAVSKAQP